MLFSKRDLRNLIIPLVIEQALAFTVGMVDTAMVANVGESAVGGVALVDSINLLMITLLMALGTGGAVVAGQYLGLGDKGRASHAAQQLVIAATLIAVCIMAACLLLNQNLLTLVFGDIGPDVMSNAVTYFYVTALSFPFIAVFNSAAALFRSMGNARTPMLASLAMNIINVGGNALFIFVLHMGVLGAALSTLISRVVVAFVLLGLLRNTKNDIHVRSYRLREIDFPMIRRILKIGVPNGLENSMFQIGKIVVTSLVAAQGTAAIAAHAVATSLAMVEVIPGMALGLAALSVVARCVGAGEYGQAQHYTRVIMKQAYLMLLVVSAGIAVFLEPILGIYQLSAETYSIAWEMMILHSIGAVLVWAPSFTLPNALRAAGDVKFTMVVSGVSMWVFRIVMSYVLVYGVGTGVTGVWIAMVIDWVFRCVLFTARWRGGKWMQYKVV